MFFSSSTSFAKILARLGVRGVVHDVTGAPAGTFERAIPLLGADNLLHRSVLPSGTVGTLPFADEVLIVNPNTGAGPLEGNEAAVNVHEALNNLTKDVDGLAVMRAKNLTDLADTDASFHNIKVPAALVTPTDVPPPAGQVSGVVSMAFNAEITGGVGSRLESDQATSGGDNEVPLFLTPAQLRQFYVNRFDAARQPLSGPLAMPVALTTFEDLDLVPKWYLDQQVGQVTTLATSRTLWVDPAATVPGRRGIRNFPFTTLAGALAAAQSGDLVVVGPGTYNETGLTRTGAFNIHWLFLPGAVINHTGTSPLPVFTVTNAQTWVIAGDGVFANYATGGPGRVFQLEGSGSLNCTCRHILSNGSPVLVNLATDPGAGAIFRVSGDIRADNLAGGGGSALNLDSGHCRVKVAGEIWSGAASGAGLSIGFNNGLATGSRVQVSAGRIAGRFNALVLQSADNPQVTADTCHAVDGPAIIARANSAAIATIRLVTNASAANSVIRLEAWSRLQLSDGRAQALLNQHVVELRGDTYNQSQVVLSNMELFRNGSLTGRCVFSQTPLNRVRILGNVHADDAAPEAVLLGGLWSRLDTFDL